MATHPGSSTNTADLLRLLAKGILSGGLVGFLVGNFALTFSARYVVSDLDLVPAVLREQIESRHHWTLVFSFMATFAAIGPFIAAAKFGPWLRHAIYGMIGCLLVVAIPAIAINYVLTGSFGAVAKSPSTALFEFAQVYGVPYSIILGPYLGVAVGALWDRYYSSRQSVADSTVLKVG